MGTQLSVGQRFGSVTTIARVGRAEDGHAKWMCRCDCGGTKVWQSNVLKSSSHASCGCFAMVGRRQRATRHGQHGTRTYSSWRAAIERCHNPESKDFEAYGARGITVCAAWRDSFEAFFLHMGERPEGKTLDRFPNAHGNYEPGNCRWATPTEQARNRRASVYVDWRGQRQHLAVVAANLGITYGAAFNRLKRGKLNDCSQ